MSPSLWWKSWMTSRVVAVLPLSVVLEEIEAVCARAAGQLVAAEIAEQNVVAAAAGQLVGVPVARQPVGERGADQVLEERDGVALGVAAGALDRRRRFTYTPAAERL